MPHRRWSIAASLLLGLLALPGCAAVQELAALRSVSFEFARGSDVRLVGIPIGARPDPFPLSGDGATHGGDALSDPVRTRRLE